MPDLAFNQDHQNMQNNMSKIHTTKKNVHWQLWQTGWKLFGKSDEDLNAYSPTFSCVAWQPYWTAWKRLCPVFTHYCFREFFFKITSFLAFYWVELSTRPSFGDLQQDIFSYFYRENLHRNINETSHANISDGFGFSHLKLSMRLYFEIIFQRTKNFGKKRSH